MKSKDRARQRRDWPRLVVEQARSGKSIKEFCSARGIHPTTFYWQRKRQNVRTERRFTEVEIGVLNEYEIRCKSGRRVIVRGAVHPEHLRAVLHAAEEIEL